MVQSFESISVLLLLIRTTIEFNIHSTIDQWDNHEYMENLQEPMKGYA
jgi:hypothetical protein